MRYVSVWLVLLIVFSLVLSTFGARQALALGDGLVTVQLLNGDYAQAMKALCVNLHIWDIYKVFGASGGVSFYQLSPKWQQDLGCVWPDKDGGHNFLNRSAA